MIQANERVATVVTDLVNSIRDVMIRNKVSHAEFHTALEYLQETAGQQYELPLMMENFFEITTAEVANQDLQGTPTTIAGPFFLEGAPEIGSKGAMKTLEDASGEPIIIRGKITDLQGKPIEGVELDVWHSTPEGTYSGVHPGIPADHYRVKLHTDVNGHYQVKTTKPSPYQIPHDGNTGKLLSAMGRHSWRPAHFHFLARKEGLKNHISQAYFKGEDYADDDCCQAVLDELVHEFVEEDGVKVLTKDFVLDPA